jgi:hypothetical protein
MSGEHAWVCSTLYMPYVPMTLAQFGTDEGVAMAGLADKHWAGERFDETALIPVAWWDMNTEGRPRKLRSAFTLHGFTCVTGPVRDVFLAHDIGQTTFVQVQLYGPDRATLVTDQLYLINLGDRKEALDVAQSKRLKKAAIHAASWGCWALKLCAAGRGVWGNMVQKSPLTHKFHWPAQLGALWKGVALG